MEETICPICNKVIKSSRISAIAYQHDETYVRHHWTCFKNEYTGSHDRTYIGVIKSKDGIPIWSDLTAKQQQSAKSTLTRIKIYGGTILRRTFISGMAATSMFMSPDDVSKTYDSEKKRNKMKMNEMKKAWLEEESKLT